MRFLHIFHLYQILVVNIVHDLNSIPPSLQQCAVTIGNFDGVHRGHAQLIMQLRARGAALGIPSVVLTFERHPLELLRPNYAPMPLTWLERKLHLLARLQVQGVVVLPVNAEFLSLNANDFFQQVLIEKLQARAVVEGANFYFGKDRSGNVERLATLCQQHSIACDIVAPVQHENDWISSSRVRELIQTGRIGMANTLLTQPFRIRGQVAHGAARGRTIGFPTANLEQVETVVPALGVYAGQAFVNEQAYAAAINVGPNPTFGEQAVKIEVHVIGFDGDLYGQTLEVSFLDRLRGIQSFASVAELRDQLRRDVAETQEFCACSIQND
jgi:riboflavin kinase / FMN adenylyltransferase